MINRTLATAVAVLALAAIVALSPSAAADGYGSAVADGDADAGLALSSFADARTLCYVDEDGGGSHGAGEPIYAAPSCGTVGSGDLRLAPTAGEDAGTQVGDDGDAGNTLQAFDGAEAAFEDANANRAFDGGETLYVDVAGDGQTSAGDLRITPTAGAAAGTFVSDGDGDAGVTLTTLADLEVASWAFHDLDDSGDWTGEDTAYVDADGSGDVSADDVRLGPTPTADPPSVTIDTPSDGDAVDVGSEVAIRGSAAPGTHGIADVSVTAGGQDLTVSGTESWSATWTPETVGDHDVVVVVTDDEGATARDAVRVQAETEDTPSVAIDVPQDGAEVREGDGVVVRGTAAPGGAALEAVTVAVDGDEIAVTGTSTWQARWTAGDAGAYTVEATVEDEVGATATATATLDVAETMEATKKDFFETEIAPTWWSDAPTMTPVPDPIHVGEPVNLTLEARGGDVASVDWFVDGEAVAGDRTLSHVFDEPGRHVVQAEATSEDGSTDTSELGLDVPPESPSPLAGNLTVSVDAGPADPDTGEAPVDLEAQVASDRDLSFRWFADGGELAQGPTASGTLDGPGHHVVGLEVSEDGDALVGWIGSVSVATADDLHPVPVRSLQQNGELVGLSAALPGDVEPDHVVVAFGAHPDPSDWSDGLVYRAEVGTDAAGEPVVRDLEPYRVRDGVTEPLRPASDRDPPADTGRVGLSPVVLDGETQVHVLTGHLDLDPLDVGDPVDVSKMQVLVQAEGDAPRCQGGCLLDALERTDPGPAFPMGSPTGEAAGALLLAASPGDDGPAVVDRAIRLPAGHGVAAVDGDGTVEGELQAEVAFGDGSVMVMPVQFPKRDRVLAPADGRFDRGDEGWPARGSGLVVPSGGLVMDFEAGAWTNGDEYLAPGYGRSMAEPMPGSGWVDRRMTPFDDILSGRPGSGGVFLDPIDRGWALDPIDRGWALGPDGRVMGGWGDVGRSSPVDGRVIPENGDIFLEGGNLLTPAHGRVIPENGNIFLEGGDLLAPADGRVLSSGNTNVAYGRVMGGWGDVGRSSPGVGPFPPPTTSAGAGTFLWDEIYTPRNPVASAGDVLIAARGGPSIGSLPQEDIASVTVYETETGRIVAESERPGDRPPLDADAWTLDVPRSVGHGDQATIGIQADPDLADDAGVGARLMFSSDGGETWSPLHAGFLDASQVETLTVDGTRLAASTGATEDARFGLLLNDGFSTALVESSPVQRPPAPPEIDVVGGGPAEPDPDRPVLGGTFAGTIPPEVGPRGAPGMGGTFAGTIPPEVGPRGTPGLGGTFAGTIPPEVGPRGMPLFVGETIRIQVQGATDAGDPLGPDDVRWSVQRLGAGELAEAGIPEGTMLHPDEGEPVSLRHVLQATGVGLEATDPIPPLDSDAVEARGNGKAYELAFGEPGVYRLQVTATDPDTGLETTRNATAVVAPQFDAASMPGEEGFIQSGSEGNDIPAPGVVGLLAASGAAAAAVRTRRGGLR